MCEGLGTLKKWEIFQPKCQWRKNATLACSSLVYKETVDFLQMVDGGNECGCDEELRRVEGNQLVDRVVLSDGTKVENIGKFNGLQSVIVEYVDDSTMYCNGDG